MTKILDDFDFGQNKGRKPLYPWASWVDGKIRLIEADKDFKCSAQSMQTQIYNKAREQGGTAQVSILEDGNIVFKINRTKAAVSV